MTVELGLAPVYYPGTYLRRTSLSRLAYLFGHLSVLRPPGLEEPAREGLGAVVEPRAITLSPEQRRLLEAVLADYRRWAADHQGAAYELFARRLTEPREESRHEVRRALQQGRAPLAADQGRLPEDLGWQILLRLAHDYDRQQEEIDALLARVSEQERELIGLAGVGLEELGEEAGAPEEPEPEPEGPESMEPEAVPEDLTTGARMAAFGRLWLATHTTGTPVTDSPAAHEIVLETPSRFGEAVAPVVFALALPDAGRMNPAEALEKRSATSGPLKGVLARLEALKALLRARDWSDEVRASVDLLALETREAAARLRAEPEAPRRTLRLSCAVVPNLEPRALFARLTGNPPPEGAASGLYLLLEAGA
jgi:hypothetical protein